MQIVLNAGSNHVSQDHPALLQDRGSHLAEGLTMMSPAASGSEFPDGLRRSGGVGGDLRLARERLGWTLPSVAAQLRIRLPFLEAIEEGRLGDLPGNAYAVGFLRTYAGAVGLDPDEISRRFRAEAADVNRKTELSFPAPVPERGVPAGAVVLVGLVLVAGAYVGWYRLSGSNAPRVEVVQAIPERLAPLVPPTQPANVAPGVASVPVVAPPAPPIPILVPTISPLAVPPPASANASASASPPAADGGRLVVRAKAEAWVQVRDKAGPVVFNRTMRAGETWPVPNKPGLLLTVGNAGGTEVLVDGIATASLGAEGAVRRDLPLDLEQVRDGKLAATPATSQIPPAKPMPKLP
jgi:cytoskeleton protein RodZ